MIELHMKRFILVIPEVDRIKVRRSKISCLSPIKPEGFVSLRHHETNTDAAPISIGVAFHTRDGKKFADLGLLGNVSGDEL